MTTYEVINVIEVENGIPSPPKSFIIINEGNKDEIVKKAEALFVELAKAHGMEEEDFDSLDAEDYENTNGYSVYINWSEVQS